MKEKMKCVILDGYTANPGDLSWDWLSETCDLTVYDRTSVDEITERAADADIIILNKVPITRKTAEALPKLKFISVLATGYNQLDCAALRELGVAVSNIPAYSTDGVAQMVFSFILEITNGVARYTESVKRGEWASCPDFSYCLAPFHELKGKTLGIIGFGRIGRKVAEIANAFSINVIAYTPSGRKEAENVTFTDIDTVISSSDFITFHCPLTESTSKLVNDEFIDKMKDGASIINTARGGIIDEDAVSRALKSGKLGYYAADVFTVEPPKADNPVINAPNTLITPHIAWAGVETRVRLMDITKENIGAFLAGKPINVVN